RDCPKAAKRLISQGLARSEDHTAIGGERQLPTLPIAGATTGSLDHRQERHVVIGLQIPLDHQIHPAARQLCIAEAISAEERQAACLHQAIEGLHVLLRGLEHGWRGTAKDCLVEARHGANADFPFLDRKSTRLNSSHVKISYAVFCLKKK